MTGKADRRETDVKETAKPRQRAIFAATSPICNEFEFLGNIKTTWLLFKPRQYTPKWTLDTFSRD